MHILYCLYSLLVPSPARASAPDTMVAITIHLNRAGDLRQFGWYCIAGNLLVQPALRERGWWLDRRWFIASTASCVLSGWAWWECNRYAQNHEDDALRLAQAMADRMGE